MSRILRDLCPPRPTRPIFLFLLLAAVPVLLAPVPARAVFGDGPDDLDDPILTRIVIEGNTRTDTGYILRELGLETGEPISRERLDEVWDHLEDLGCFAYVDMEYDDFEPGEVILVVTVEEDDTVGWGPWVRYSQRHKYLAGVYAENRNLRGQGEVLRGELVALYIQRARLSWTRPWFLGQKRLDARIALLGEQADFVYRPFRYRRGETDVSLHWAGQAPFFVTAGAAGAAFDIRDDFSWAAPDRGDGATGSESWDAGVREWVGPRLAVGVDARSNPHYPSRGVYAEAAVQRWAGSDFHPYTQSTLDLRAWLPLPHGHHLLALRAWGRATSGAAHLDNVVFLGGESTVRGHHPAGREGDEAYLLSVEYRLPITMMRISPQGDLAGVGVHVFGDAGDTWWYGADPGSSLRSWGAGLHLNIDKMQLRFEAARTIGGDWSFEFGDRMTF